MHAEHIPATTDAQLRLIVENVPALIAYYDADWRIQYFNRAAANWFDISPENTIGMHLRDLAGSVAFGAIEPFFACAYQGEPVSYEREHIRPDGQSGHVRVNLMPDINDAGRVIGVYSLSLDVTDSVTAHAEMTYAKERLDYAMRASNLAMWDANLATGQIFLSSMWTEMLGHPVADSVATLDALLALTHPDDQTVALDALKGALKNTDLNNNGVEIRVMTRSGWWKWIKVRGKTTGRDESGRAIRMSGTIVDISARKHHESSLRFKEAQLRLVLDNVPAMIFYTDTSLRYLLANKRYADFFGVDPEEIVGMHIRDVIGTSTYRQYHAYLEAVLAGSAVSYKRDVHFADGSLRFVEVTLIPDVDAEGRVLGWYSLSRYITENVEAESRISHMIHHDALTDMLNRSELEARLRTLLTGMSGASHILLYLNVDLLKMINDSCGHAAGDEALRQIAAILRANVAGGHMLTRMSSDEFGVLLENVTLEQAREQAEAIREAVHAARFAWKDRSFSMGVSIGVVALEGQNVADLLAAGDAACQAAKNKGRNRISIFQPGDNEIALRRSQIDWRERILHALEHNQFRLYWQAISPLREQAGDPRHYEVLLRMSGAGKNVIAPMAFVPAAEHFGLMPLIDRWVVSATFAANMAHHQDEGSPHTIVAAINLSGQTLGDEHFPDFLHEQFAQFPINPRSICFEITETAAISNLGQAIRFMNEFKRIGCQFSLDDFGSGMSSFGYLRNLPVDYLKIDGSFIRNLHRDSIDYAMVESINHIGHLLGKITIAEFVESARTLQLLKKIGVDYVQGYFVGKPQSQLDDPALVPP